MSSKDSDTPVRVLVVDDEPAIRRILRTSLTAHGYQVSEAPTGLAAITTNAQHRPDIIILDLNLPDLQGTEVTRRLRTSTDAPIIILSVRGQEQDKVAALDAGADDYLVKPFSFGELTARLRANLRRMSLSSGEPFIFRARGLTVDLSRRLVMLNGDEVQLTPTEYSLMQCFVRQAGQVLTHSSLLRQVWGKGYEEEVHMLRVNISNLRRKIEANPSRPQLILTEPGVGYRLKTE